MAIVLHSFTAGLNNSIPEAQGKFKARKLQEEQLIIFIIPNDTFFSSYGDFFVYIYSGLIPADEFFDYEYLKEKDPKEYNRFAKCG
ncbi:hypothetical protein GCM10011571_29660 [Marinithermofilum abyssi]|uniref:Uncharacterized protein n=1 Tax=Marinithermofilum abyssi TaxID=1571185 RepID=A0A8J2VCC0_9BACL|nr:hypothetical protein GCM10011571_29660 [Marinithermofilum abyssi]